MADLNHVKCRDKDELIGDYLQAVVNAQGNTNAGTAKQIELGVNVRCTEDIVTSIKSLSKTISDSSSESSILSKRIFWLNIILTIATVVAAIGTVGQLFIK